jgi:CheY-like chemotaxis protein
MSRVLIVDADPSVRELSAALSGGGCAVDVVTDGRVAVPAATRMRPDVIVLAAELPDPNGFVLCNELKRDASLRGTKVIIVSRHVNPKALESHSKLPTRADEYVNKPTSAQETAARVFDVIEASATPSAPEPRRDTIDMTGAERRPFDSERAPARRPSGARMAVPQERASEPRMARTASEPRLPRTSSQPRMARTSEPRMAKTSSAPHMPAAGRHPDVVEQLREKLRDERAKTGAVEEELERAREAAAETERALRLLEARATARDQAQLEAAARQEAEIVRLGTLLEGAQQRDVPSLRREVQTLRASLADAVARADATAAEKARSDHYAAELMAGTQKLVDQLSIAAQQIRDLEQQREMLSAQLHVAAEYHAQEMDNLRNEQRERLRRLEKAMHDTHERLQKTLAERDELLRKLTGG